MIVRHHLSARELKKEHVKTIKKCCLEVEKRRFWRKNSYLKNRCSKTDFLIKFLDGSAWFCMEKLKKHISETPKPKKYKKDFPPPQGSPLFYRARNNLYVGDGGYPNHPKPKFLYKFFPRTLSNISNN